ncbi:D-amino-acid transaminase [Suttonella sp. R2A3]|uniref:D-amino-acid transaminase n=1 Tax=Suttonella sp. R2A3 TaxID=2908648 RepID=UPI001F3D3899|nr:D-amino-acid transaminase [Suttonella sp. R2A3]UJF23852.1 D-amino-acid transaminase [Suttonella sp. R2A3]
MTKLRTVYVNGEFVAENEAKISIFDRGFLMADAVYEVSAVLNGAMLDNEAHLARLERSLTELNMTMPMSAKALINIQEALIADNRLKEGVVYLQVTRGSADRDFVFDPNMQQNVVLFTQAKNLLNDPMVHKGLRVMTQQDIRWQRRDIKTTQLLAQSLAKMMAKNNGYDDAWMVDDAGQITEGSSSNAWIIQGDKAVTRPASHDILNGITRRTLIEVLGEHGLTLEERCFSVEEAQAADEAFVTSAGGMVMPVVAIDKHVLADGKPGARTLALRQAYIDRVTNLNANA